MLIDVNWQPHFAKRKVDKDYISKFNTKDGGLYIEMTYPSRPGRENVFPRRVARRVHTGVYYSFDLHHAIENYTRWNVKNLFETMKSLFDLTCSTEDPEKKKEHHTRLIRMPSPYGVSDDLKHVFRYGRSFLRSDDPHVLQLSVRNVNCDTFCSHGPYIGKTKKSQLENALHFHFYRLIEKD